VDFVPKVKIDIVVPDEQADAVVDAINTSARTGQIGDDNILVSIIEQAVHIRTSEAGDDVL
jgi:nitrogen regulatory protein P-II 1